MTPVTSRVKLLVTALLALPTASVATTLTVMVPPTSLPVPRSAASSVMACAEPVPVTVLVTVRPGVLLSVKVTTTVAPNSAATVTTPPLCVASAAVAPPLLTPVPRAITGAAGLAVSTSGLEALLAVTIKGEPLTVPPSVTSTR